MNVSIDRRACGRAEPDLGNPVAPRDYDGSRERDPNPEPTASLHQTPGKQARPNLPSNRRARASVSILTPIFRAWRAR